MTTETALIEQLAQEIKPLKQHNVALALDFDGVCKLFTDYKHQIMSTCLFLHMKEFQRVPFQVFRDAYVYINFRSDDYAGKERFLCVSGLSQFLADKGYDCALPGVNKAVATLRDQGKKINEDNLGAFTGDEDVARLIGWSRDVNDKLTLLTEIGLAPGVNEDIFQPFKGEADFYVVSTACEGQLRASMEKESIDFVLRYFGQETASKAESLLAMSQAGYDYVLMFGDSLEDSRASAEAAAKASPDTSVLFVAVIPGDEAHSFNIGRKMIEAVQAGDAATAEAASKKLAAEFEGREAGSASPTPINIRA